MNCPRHPGKKVVAECRECGSGMCIECVRETDQTTLCADCLRRKRSETEREYGVRAGGERAPRLEEERARGGPMPGSAGTSSEAALPKPAPGREEVRDEGAAPAAGASVPRSAWLRERQEGGITAAKVASAVENETRTRETSVPPKPVPESGFKLRPREGKWLKGRKVGEGATEAAEEGRDEDEAAGADFLARGPDEDFSLLEEKKPRSIPRWRPGRKIERGETAAGGHMQPAAYDEGAMPVPTPKAEKAEAAPPGRRASRGGGEKETASPARQARGGKRRAPMGAGAEADTAEDALLREVVSTLLLPEGSAMGTRQPDAAVLERPLRAPAPGAGRRGRKRRAREEAGGERAERWAFLAQPRSSEYTMIALTWWRAALFIAAALLGGAALWAVVNAYLIPRDTEYGALAIVLGVVIGLAFWWKAGRKHGTKLAVQASIITFFSLFLGEFLHWFLIVVKNDAFRTIFFDLVSFRFIWENGPEIMRNVIEAMFPTGFLLILILPTLAAFIIAFGMPPIPEVFTQFWRALRGQGAE